MACRPMRRVHGFTLHVCACRWHATYACPFRRGGNLHACSAPVASLRKRQANVGQAVLREVTTIAAMQDLYDTPHDKRLVVTEGRIVRLAEAEMIELHIGCVAPANGWSNPVEANTVTMPCWNVKEIGTS